MLDPLMLARIQFAANISFHILFPTITIALGWILLFFRVRHFQTQNPKWLEAYQFWVKIFALSFALGIVSGVTMSFQFGTNWPVYMETVGNIAGPLLAYEVLTAFFMEATFLGIMLFGAKRVPPKIHLLATALVAIGTTLSAFWILSLNSWMQTPAGFEMIDGKAYVTNWLEVVFNPSMPYRLSHMLLASGLTASFLVAGISAYRWLRGDRGEAVHAALRTGVFAAAVMIPLQILVGDMHGLNTLHHQPQKIAAMEGIWETEKGAPLLLFAWPDETLRQNRFSVGVPHGASLILTHAFEGELKGLNSFENHPPVKPLFFGFRVMVGVGMLMLLSAWAAGWQLLRRQTLSPLVAKVLIGMTFSGWVATLAGWYVTEIGRQPWLVTGILKTADAAAANVTAPMLTSSLIMYLSLYAFLLVAFMSSLFYLAKKAFNPAFEAAPPPKTAEEIQ